MKAPAIRTARWRWLVEQAEETVRTSAFRYADHRIEQLVADGWCEIDAEAALAGWWQTAATQKHARHLIREETYRLLEPGAPSVALQ